jgi:hypothetical protein
MWYSPFFYVVNEAVEIYTGKSTFKKLRQPGLCAMFECFVNRYIESVVVRPGLAPQWLAGSMSYSSHIVTMSSAWQLLNVI